MKRKTARKQKVSQKTKKQFLYNNIIWIPIYLLVIVFGGMLVYKSLRGVQVLGDATTGSYGAPPSGGNQPPQQSQQQQPPGNQQPPQGNAQLYQPQQMNGSQQNQQMQQGNMPPPDNQGLQQLDQQHHMMESQMQMQNTDQKMQNPQQMPHEGMFTGQVSPAQQNNAGPGTQNPPLTNQLPGQVQNIPQQNTQFFNQVQNNGDNPPTGISQNKQDFQEQFKKKALDNGIQYNGTLPQQLQGNNSQQGLINNPGNQTIGQPLTPLNGNFQSLPSPKEFPTITGNFEVQTANNGSKVNLNDASTKIQLGNENANLAIKAKQADGTVITINDDQLQKINAAMFTETGATVANGDGGVVLKRDGVSVQSTLPISFNVVSKTFTVQSPSGEKEITVFPDQVVQKLLKSNILSTIGSNTASQNQQGTTTDQSAPSPITLTEFNNQSVYQVNGIAQKKIFGLVPVTIPKTTLLSAQTGDLVQTNESFFNKILDTLSQ